MSVGRYLLGVVLLAIALAPLLLAARGVRRRVLPAWSGSAASVAEAVVFLSLLVVALELVGVLGLFGPAGITVACALLGAVAWRAARRRGPATALAFSAPAERWSADRIPLALAVVALAALVAAWAARTIFAYGHGMDTVDTLWYHLPAAARFVQDGDVLGLQYFDGDAITAFYPGNSYLVHAFGLALFGQDVLSPLVNVGWAVLALVAAWAIGRPSGRGPHCVVAALFVLATPTMVETQPAGGYNDVATMALVLAAVALLVNGGLGRPTSVLAAMAAGLALGTKLTMLAPALALAIGVVTVTPRGRRLGQAGVWAAGLALLGGLWYLRNLVLVGNPLPSLDVTLGPLSLPSTPSDTPTESVAQYLTNGQVWRGILLPGLREALGPVWPALLALSAAGAVLAVVSGRDRVVRMLGVVAAVSALAYVVAPQTLGLPGIPVFFRENLRYLMVALVLGLVLLPIQPALRARGRALALVAVTTLALLVTQIDPAIWPTGFDWRRFEDPVRGAEAVAGALVGLAALVLGLVAVARRGQLPRPRAPRGVLPALGAGALAAGLAGGWLVSDLYAGERYRDTRPLPALYGWAQDVRDARIGVVGLNLQYPLYGRDLSNRVEYVGTGRPRRGFGPATSCPAWRRAVDAARYDWLLLTPRGFPIGSEPVAAELAWTRTSPAAELVRVERPERNPVQTAHLFRLRGRLDANACPP